MLLVAVCIACSDSEWETPVPGEVNVVWIIADDLGWRDLGFTGSTFHETPNIDRLERDGVYFAEFHTASPVCSPTRASLLTGKHPARLGLRCGSVGPEARG